METNDISRMANQIAAFFKDYGEEEGKREVAAHLNNFWEPRMRRQLFAYAEAGGTDVDALVLAALPLVRRPT